MPDKSVKTIQDLLFYQYAKIGDGEITVLDIDYILH